MNISLKAVPYEEQPGFGLRVLLQDLPAAGQPGLRKEYNRESNAEDSVRSSSLLGF